MKTLRYLLPLLLLAVLPWIRGAGNAPRPVVPTAPTAAAGRAAAGAPEGLDKAIEVGNVRLKDGTSLRNVRLIMFNADTVYLASSSGERTVPYEQFPDQLQPTLARYRPPAKAVMTVRAAPGAVVEVRGSVTSRPPPPEDPNAPLAPPKQIYSGRIYLATGDRTTAPLPNITVFAMRPADYAAYNRERLARHGAAIEAVKKKFAAASAAGDRAGATAAGQAALLAVYDSFAEPPVPYADFTTTAENGSFRLECAEEQVILVARARIASGDRVFPFAWAVPAQAGGRTLLDDTNIVSP